MKNLSIFILLFVGIWSQLAFSAIGCVPGDCCGGRPCSSPTPTPPPHNPRPNPGPCKVEKNAAIMALTANMKSCTSVNVLDCSSCEGEGTTCARHYDENGQSFGFSCVQCH